MKWTYPYKISGKENILSFKYTLKYIYSYIVIHLIIFIYTCVRNSETSHNLLYSLYAKYKFKYKRIQQVI